VPALDHWLSTTFTPDRIDNTLDKIVEAQPDPDADTSTDNQIINECDRKLATYRATLDAGGEPKVIGEWIAQTQATKSLAEARQRQRGTSPKRFSREQIHYIVTTLTDITQVIHDADPRDKAEIHSQLGLTYHPGKTAVLVEARPGPVCIRFVSEDRHLPDAYAIPLVGKWQVASLYG
jgi:site-specific DNA recombinase